jgi:hypothetical protein
MLATAVGVPGRARKRNAAEAKPTGATPPALRQGLAYWEVEAVPGYGLGGQTRVHGADTS